MNTMLPTPTDQPDNDTNVPVEQIAPGLTRSWLQHRQIVVFTASAASRDVVDAWIACVKETMEHWPKGQPYLAIHDFTSEKVWLTPYARKRAEELLPLDSGTPGYAALLLSPNFVSHVVRMYLRLHKQQGNENQIFFTMWDAIKWLRTKASSFKAAETTR